MLPTGDGRHDVENAGARMKPERCAAIAASGQPCSAVPRPGRPFCLWHDPEATEARREISRKGGQGRSNRARTRKQLGTDALSMPEVAGLLSLTLRGVIAGRFEPGVGNSVASLARALTAVHEATELEDRIAALEQAAEIGGKTA